MREKNRAGGEGGQRGEVGVVEASLGRGWDGGGGGAAAANMLCCPIGFNTQPRSAHQIDGGGSIVYRATRGLVHLLIFGELHSDIVSDIFS